jgi:NADPH-dependent 2,4-dienoyl-CoA reductase/sulfur reductase-like enzyme
MNDGTVIVGGGLAAQRCCETLRSKGYEGPIRVLCGESLPPYDRPPLSKELLSGELPEEAIALRPRAWYEERGVDLLLGAPAIRLLPAEQFVELEGSRLRYDNLVVATGSEARSLPMLEGYENVQPLRTLDDARELRAALGKPGCRVAVVGAGFIGLEVAATARKLGAEVTLVEAAAAPLAAVLGTQLGAWFAQLHREEGVEVITSAGVAEVRGARRVSELVLADGRRVPCDRVVVGVGVRPATRWLADAGIADLGGGVPVDPHGRSAAPGVYAAGDAALVFDPALARHLRTDHWEAAARQGAAAARSMLGLDQPPEPPPSFWSDQYGVRVQYVGRASEADRIVIDGDPDGRDFQADMTRDGVPVGVLLVGRPRALPDARRRVMQAMATTTGNGGI